MKIKILYLEDFIAKADKVCDVIKRAGYNDSIDIKGTYRDGLITLLNNKYDFLLLDMGLPMNDSSNNKIQTLAGKEILQEIKRKKYDIKVAVITGFETFGEHDEITKEKLDEELWELYPGLYQGMIFYNKSSEEWSENLISTLNKRRKELDNYNYEDITGG